ncbi:hypothetical protein EUGRSUZ_D01801 [Eucalyptus grandis]|uniref:Glycoside hydrolase family 5 domain-containing protein n=2 Tax=Eucalyptus grandis TaxID=71139 RepID=A0A059CG98_EUCGR|nr:hypothetical protein EUGRSUZ_D01801 [Eucalyptus grandis]
MTHVEAYAAVVDELWKQGMMVVLDNQVSKPNRCCPYNDGSSFFGDEYFNPEEWLRGLVGSAARDWYRYIRTAATKVHRANPNVLVILSGLTWASNLGFLRKRPVGLHLGRKPVHESHRYSFRGDRKIWEVQPVDRVCTDAGQRMDDQVGFLSSGPGAAPLFLGELGLDQTGKSRADDWLLSCFMGYAAGKDLDWALWALQSSGLKRPSAWSISIGMGSETQSLGRDPSSNSPMSYIMYHPQSGLCIRANNNHEIGTAERQRWSRWSHYRDGGPIRLMGTPLCLQALGDGLPPALSNDCSSQRSAWRSISNSKLHVAATDEHGNRLCWEKKSNESSLVLTRKCICVDDDSGCMENPQGQWFKFVPTNT